MPIKCSNDVSRLLSHYVEVLLHQFKALLQSPKACLYLTLLVRHILHLSGLTTCQLGEFRCNGRADALQRTTILLQLLQ